MKKRKQRINRMCAHQYLVSDKLEAITATVSNPATCIKQGVTVKLVSDPVEGKQ